MSTTLKAVGHEGWQHITELGKLKTTFTTAGFTTEDTTKTHKELYAVLGDDRQTVEAHGNASIKCTSQGASTLVFSCEAVPTTNIKVNVFHMGV